MLTYKEAQEFKDKMAKFFLEYVEPVGPEAYQTPGVLKDAYYVQAARCLLREGVFDDVREMKMVALKDHGIILPDSIFKESA